MACLLSVQASFTNTVFHMAALTHEQFSNTIDRELHHEVSHASWVKCAIIDRYVFTRCWERIPNAAVVLDSVSRSALVNTWMIQCNANLHYVSFRNRAYDHRLVNFLMPRAAHDINSTYPPHVVQDWFT